MKQTDVPLYLIPERRGFKAYWTLAKELKRVDGITPRRCRQNVTWKTGI